MVSGSLPENEPHTPRFHSHSVGWLEPGACWGPSSQVHQSLWRPASSSAVLARKARDLEFERRHLDWAV